MGASLTHPATGELRLATVMDALSDPVRVTIVRALAAEGETQCGILDLGVSPATRSHHFRVLREAGVIAMEARGRERIITLRRDDLDARFPGLLGSVLAAL